MVGSVFGEFAFNLATFNKYELSDDLEKEMLCKKFGEHTQELMELFVKAYPEKKAVDLLLLDRIFRTPSKELAKLLAEGGKAPAFLYNFTLEFPIAHGKAAWHCSDIPFVFHNTDKVEICNMMAFQMNWKKRYSKQSSILHKPVIQITQGYLSGQL